MLKVKEILKLGHGEGHLLR